MILIVLIYFSNSNNWRKHCGTSRGSDLQPLLQELHAAFLSVRELVRKTPITNQENHGLGQKMHHRLTFHRGCFMYLLQI